MALKQGQHGRIVRITNKMNIMVHYDREVERYTVAPDDLERVLMLAAMSGNVFQMPSEEEDTGYSHGH